MRIFVFEYITGGGCVNEEMIPSLKAEGDMMLDAVVSDFSQLESIEVLICRDARLDALSLASSIHWVDNDWWSAWLLCLEEADAVLPIAPETHGVLESLCRSVEASGKLLLNSSAEAVAIASSKKATVDCLAMQGVPVIPTWRYGSHPIFSSQPLVVKPDHGVGCRDIHIIANDNALQAYVESRDPLIEWVVQPYLAGQSISMSVMVGHCRVCLVGTNIQQVVQMNDGFDLLGCVVNGLQSHQAELLGISKRICEAIPGLWGYVGVDLILTDQGPVVLEINPRLTTAYVGLTQSTGRNLAEMIMQLAESPDALPTGLITGECVHIDLELGRVA
ncbi:MAG: ATP-grasp domain-containing protein [Sedimenticola sp.]|nr:ATP-grasp domain-containing protein [Sedimenticola sp.]